jgi:hypothetical protein
VEFSRALNPELKTFNVWLKENAARIPLDWSLMPLTLILGNMGFWISYEPIIFNQHRDNGKQWFFKYPYCLKPFYVIANLSSNKIF